MSKREKIMLVVLAGVVVLSGGYTTYAYKDKLFGKKTTSPVAVSNNNLLGDNSNINVNENSNSSEKTITPIVDAGVDWIVPEKLANLNLFTQKDDFDCSVQDMQYYKTANLTSGGEIIFVKASCGMGGDYKILFKKDKEGRYYYLTKHNDSNGLSLTTPDNYLTDYGNKTFIDSVVSYSSILPPDALTTDGNVLLKKSGYDYSGLFSDVTNATKIGNTSYGSLYKTQGEGSDVVVSRSLVVKLADSTIVTYNPTVSFILDDNVANVTLDGKNNTSIYIKSLSIACGSHAGHSILRSASDLSSRLIAYGTTPDDDALYYIKNENDSIVDYVYNFYKTGREGGAISKTEFYAKKPFFVWKDPFGDYMIFLNQEYAPLAECGKPVVYLYPQKTTQVKVEVGANITKSDPAYGAGWSVLAFPSGKLVLGDKTYNSLFWEGQGNGAYPEVKSGFIVAKENIESTLIDHLTRLGLNDKEKADFLEFWLPKMPETPYVRLTWFGTREMDILAPLKVEPKPDTSIRIFLDYEGIVSPINIETQQLSALPRKGFTLVEWGGLLRGDLK